MRIFAVPGVVPFERHGEKGVTASNLVFYQLLLELQNSGNDIILQCLFGHSCTEEALTTPEKEALAHLELKGFTILPPIFPKDYREPYTPERFRSFKLLLSNRERMEHFYPSVSLAPLLQKRMNDAKADIAVSFWNPEGVGALFGDSNIPRVAYHGDIGYVPQLAQMKNRSLFGGKTPSLLSRIDQSFRMYLQKKAHRTLMNNMDALAHIAAHNVSYYASHGQKHSVYVRNTWPDFGDHSSPFVRGDPVKIIGHIGYLDRTGSTFGLQFLLKEVLPELEKQFGDQKFEVHVIGGGEILPSLRPYLEHPNIRVRGFVEDLDSELLSSDVFCILNNAGPYQSCYTRHLLAWSMGLCLIAHSNSTLPIPEIVHEDNALLGSSGAEVAQCIVRAVSDAGLNARLRLSGRKTYEECFRPPTVAKRLEKVLQDALNRHKSSVG